MKSISDKQIEILKKILTPKVLSDLSSDERDTMQQLISVDTPAGQFQLFVDGAANLQEKTAGIGGHIQRNGEELYRFAEFLPDSTNNEAEYSAMIRGLKAALDLNLSEIEVFADSELVVRQINGQYKVKHENMIPLHRKAKQLLGKFQSWSVTHIPREKNKLADQLSKEGLKEGRTS